MIDKKLLAGCLPPLGHRKLSAFFLLASTAGAAGRYNRWRSRSGFKNDKDDVMDDDPYLKMIDDVWDKILLVYNTFRGKKQIIEFDVSKQKIYSYPADDYIRQLSERTQASTRQMFADISKRNKFLLFVRDNANHRLRSYVFDLPE